MQNKTEFDWNLDESEAKLNPEIDHNDLRKVILPVKVIFKWSDKIEADWDEETGEVLEYRSGWLMEVLPCTMIYNNEPTMYLGHVQPSKDK